MIVVVIHVSTIIPYLLKSQFTIIPWEDIRYLITCVRLLINRTDLHHTENTYYVLYRYETEMTLKFSFLYKKDMKITLIIAHCVEPEQRLHCI